MYKYGNWKPADCSTTGGTVKVLKKPEHGTLVPKRETISIGISRHHGKTACFGKSIDGFVVYYTSASGYRGPDNFTIAVTYGRHAAAVDTYTVNVE